MDSDGFYWNSVSDPGSDRGDGSDLPFKTLGSGEPDFVPDRGGSLPGPPWGGFCVLSFEPLLEPFSSESLLGNYKT